MNRKPRVLLLSASSGAGHVRAAQALEKAFAARGDCDVEHLDAIDYVSKLFQRAYDDTYIAMVKRAPELMGVLYERTDQPWHHPRRRLALDRLNSQPMIRMLKRVQPDLCVATHFLPAEIIAWLIAKKKLTAKNAIVVTDYDVHAMWLCRTVGRYYLAIPEAAEYLAGIGVPREILRVTGIPVDPLFAVPLARAAARAALNLDSAAPMLLLSAGGYGVGPLEQLVRDLLALQKPWQLVAIAGKSEPVKKRICSLAKPAASPLPKPWLAICPWPSSNPSPARNFATLITCSKRARPFAAIIFRRRPGRLPGCLTTLRAWQRCAKPRHKWPAPTRLPRSRKTRFVCYTNFLPIGAMAGKPGSDTFADKTLLEKRRMSF